MFDNNAFSKKLVTLLLGTALSMSLHAEQMFSDDRYEIHYNAFNSTFVTADVAARHGLTRSGNRALMNVAILEKLEDGTTQPTTAVVTAQSSNLLQQVQDITYRQVTESDAIYYLGEFRFTNEELLNFTLSVQPDPNQPAYQIQFQQTFYQD
ncbi:DUF4426 domain-containing protein [Nitrincola tibetensis]|uniref:DUF4426 domain-containing protein n=1 Tax=Nitrincola tibetensis TaxID=2219697 RepID=A0A364NNY2_9GAMM|nr:DUF4426 domain-containing protein [Nitrincola tibetensis]RAU18793.1 DUF4426 domain-containing protein [Nitrincola tibetensis]